MPFSRLSMVVALLACTAGERDTFTVDTALPPPTCGLCDDGDDCSDDFCLDGQCVHVGVELARACTTNLHCDDGDACTTDTCSPFRGCGFKRCRNAPARCDDGDPCTYDFCERVEGCVAVPADQWLACSGDDDCADTDPCTRDQCVPIAGCPRSRCEYAPVAQCGERCESERDCPRHCNEVACIDGACIEGAAIPGCSWSCTRSDSEPADQLEDAWSVRGFALPAGCDACPCTSDLVLAGTVARLPLIDVGTGLAWGECTVDGCAGSTRCEPLAPGRGYVIHTKGGDSPASSRALFVIEYCVATHSELMVGDWLGVLAVGDQVARFDAWVEPVHDDDNVTRMVIAGTTSGLRVPAQTVLLPDGGTYLDVVIETEVGAFSGLMFASPTGLHGNLHDDTGRVGYLSFLIP